MTIYIGDVVPFQLGHWILLAHQQQGKHENKPPFPDAGFGASSGLLLACLCACASSCAGAGAASAGNVGAAAAGCSSSCGAAFLEKFLRSSIKFGKAKE